MPKTEASAPSGATPGAPATPPAAPRTPALQFGPTPTPPGSRLKTGRK